MQTIFSHSMTASSIAYHSASSSQYPSTQSSPYILSPRHTSFYYTSIILSLSLSLHSFHSFHEQRRRRRNHGPREYQPRDSRGAIPPGHGCMQMEPRRQMPRRNVSSELASTRFAVLYLAYRNVTGVSAVYQSRARQPVIVDNEILIQCARSRRSCTRTNAPRSRPLSFRERTGWKL